MNIVRGEGFLETELCEENNIFSRKIVKLQGIGSPSINHGQTGVYIGLAGHGFVNIGGRLVEIKRGSHVVVPPEVPFQDWSDGKEPLIMESTYAPPFSRDRVEIIKI